MKMRAQFFVEVDAPDFIGAADHQRSIEALFEMVKAQYPAAEMSIKAVREMSPAKASRAQPRRLMPTGNLSLYEEPA